MRLFLRLQHPVRGLCLLHLSLRYLGIEGQLLFQPVEMGLRLHTIGCPLLAAGHLRLVALVVLLGLAQHGAVVRGLLLSHCQFSPQLLQLSLQTGMVTATFGQGPLTGRADACLQRLFPHPDLGGQLLHSALPEFRINSHEGGIHRLAQLNAQLL